MKKLLPFLLFCLLFSGCGQNKKTTDTIFAMDTVMTLTIYDSGTGTDLAMSESRAEIYRLEDILSATAEDSEIALLNQGHNEALSYETCSLLTEAMRISAATGGAYDPTVYALMELWGFYNDDYSVPTEDALQEALSHTGYFNANVGYGTISLPESMGMDLGGIAKGYASMQVLEKMDAHGVEAAVISLGGNVGLLGTKPDGSTWTVAVEKPDGSGETIATMMIPGGDKTYVVTSGAYQRYFEKNGETYHHILDPSTGYPADTDLKSVTIVSHDGTLADALSTALFVMGFEEAVEFWQSGAYEFDMVLVTENGIFATPDLNIISEHAITPLEETP